MARAIAVVMAMALALAQVPALGDPGPAGAGSADPLGAVHDQADVVIRSLTAREGQPLRVTGAEAKALAALGADLEIVSTPVPLTVSRGLAEMNVAPFHDAGHRGQGVKVAVVDLGFDGYRWLLGGDLPTSVRTRSFRQDGDLEAGTRHGTAVAEIVHDVAPEADLYLVNYDYDLAEVVDWLIAEEVDVVSFSLGYLTGPFDGSSWAAHQVDRARAAGIVWVTAAGNYALHHWGGIVADDDRDRVLEVGSRETTTFTVGPGVGFSLYLSWVGAADVDLCVRQAAESEAVCAAARQKAGEVHGQEIAHLINASPETVAYHVELLLHSGSPDRVDLYAHGTSPLTIATSAQSLVVPADARGALAVGALGVDAVMPYSSHGPTADGRVKPDVAAPAGVSTASSGTFGGTSSATPHVAGLAAVLGSAYPETRGARLDRLVRLRAAAMGTPLVYGAGLAQAGPVTPACQGHAPTILGTEGADVLTGTNRPDVILGGAGPDWIHGGAGNDIICGGAGDDHLLGGAGVDRISGGDGSDELRGGPGHDLLDGGEGPDHLVGDGGRDRMDGGPGADILVGGPGPDVLWGGSGGDHMIGGHGRDVIDGGSGDDVIAGRGGPDVLKGSGGADLLLGDTGADTIDGGEGPDRIGGGPGDDLVHGGPGSDSIRGALGDDVLFGDTGHDTIDGGPGFDEARGGPGADQCIGEVRVAC